MFDVKTIGKSKFTLGFLGAFVLGIFFADKINFGFIWSLSLIFGLIFAAVLFWQDKIYLLVFVTLIGLFGGLLYYHFWDHRESQKKLTYDENIAIDGWISEKPVQDPTDQKIILKFQKTKILVQVDRYPEFHYGDKLEIKSVIKNPKSFKTGEDGFNYGDYLLKRGIRGEIKNPKSVKKVGSGGNVIIKNIYFVGDRFENTLNQVLAEPYAALQAGILLGSKRNIPDSLMSAFNRVSLTHIVAVSGYNLMVIVSVLGILFARYSRRWAFWGSIIGIIFFVILTGAPASVVRAAVLASLILWAKILGRRPYYPILILFSAAAMLLFNPYALKNDLSFQLSFLAFIGLVILSPKISALKPVQKMPKIIKSAFSETMSAQILVLPILLFNFGILSLIAPLANILVLPVIPASMLLGFLAGILGIIFLPLGKLIGLLAWIVLKYIIVVTEFLSRFSYSAIVLKVTDWWWIPIYYLIIYLVFSKVKVKNEKKI